MNKNDVIARLNALKNEENAERVDELLGMVQANDEEKVNKVLEEAHIADTEQLDAFLNQKMEKMQKKFTPLNDTITYGTSGGSVHLHLPVLFKNMDSRMTNSQKVEFVHFKVIDALERLAYMKKIGIDPNLQDVSSIFMISPILSKREVKFFESLGFNGKVYRMNDEEELTENESREKNLGAKIFSDAKSVGAISMKIDKLYTPEWQQQKNNVKQDIFQRIGKYVQNGKEGKEDK